MIHHVLLLFLDCASVQKYKKIFSNHFTNQKKCDILYKITFYVNAVKRNSNPDRGHQRADGRCKSVDAEGRTRR